MGIHDIIVPDYTGFWIGLFGITLMAISPIGLLLNKLSAFMIAGIGLIILLYSYLN